MGRSIPAAALFLLPAAARACTVCFGGQTADMSRGFYWGVILLLVLPPLLILSFIGLVAYHIRRHQRALQPRAE